MIALHEELMQRMKTVVDTDSATDDDDGLTMVVFQPSTGEPDVGRVDLQRVDSDRLPAAPEKKPAVAIPALAIGRASGRPGGDRGLAARPISSHAPPVVARRQTAQLVLCLNKYGDKQGELKDPLGVACLPGGEIIVSEWGNKRLQVFDANGRSIRLIAPGQVKHSSNFFSVSIY